MGKIAVVDLGTNTFHLLIAEVDGENRRTIYSEKVAVRLGKEGIENGIISEQAIGRALQTMIGFKSEIDKHSISKIVATATSAFRNAKNGLELAESIKNSTGIKIEIISGDKEAELIYWGVREALSIGENPSLIVDIGGGSVEFILANDKKIFWKQSFEVGGQRMIELFQKTDPIRNEDINALKNYLSEKLFPIKNALKLYPTSVLIGSSGSFDTFSEMVLRKKGVEVSIESEKEFEILLPEFYEIYNLLIAKNRDERMKLPGMLELRVDMIVVASVLVKFIIEEFAVSRIRVSTYALKEGLLAAVIKNGL